MFLSFLEIKIFLMKFSSFSTPLSLSFWWNMGFLLIVSMFLQVGTGLILSLQINTGLFCLDSKMYVFKEVSFGWVLMVLHSMVPSYMFFFIYLHMFKSFLYQNQSKHPMSLWLTGIMIYLFFILLVFTGYCLLNGSMGYWAMNVGEGLLKYILGGKNSSMLMFDPNMGMMGSTLWKIFTYHYLCSFMVIILMILHIFILHKGGSSNLSPMYNDLYSFSLLMLLKDFFFSLVSYMILFLISFFFPELFFVGENFLEVNEYKAMEIKVEWYLSVYFMMLSSMSNKFFGIIFMILFIFSLVFKPLYKDLFGLKIFSVFLSMILFISIIILVFNIANYPVSSSLYSLSFFLLVVFNLSIDLLIIPKMYIKLLNIKF